MALANSLRKTAAKVIAKFGGEVTFRRTTTGAYNATTGTASVTVSTTTVRGVLEDVNDREANELIKVNDKKLTIAAADLSFVPSVSDQVSIGGQVMQVIQIKKIEQDNIAIVFEIYINS